MAKVARAYFGNDSTGRPVEVAESVNGKWFCRFYEFNGFAKAWSKWSLCATPPSFKLRGTNVYSGEQFDIEKGKVLNWGFKALSLLENTPRWRLPE